MRRKKNHQMMKSQANPLKSGSLKIFHLLDVFTVLTMGAIVDLFHYHKDDYERHIVMKHAGKPAYPGTGRYRITWFNS